MSEGVVPTYPTGVILTRYYTQIDALTNAQGQPTNAITPNEGEVTVSGITDAAPSTGSTIQAFLIPYQVGNGLPQESADYAATSNAATATDLHETDSQGNELYSWSVTLPTSGLSPGLYVLQSFVHTQAYVQSNGTTSPVEVYEYDAGTVTVDEFTPFTYVVQEDKELVSVGAAQTTSVVDLPNANSTAQISTDGRYVVWTSGTDQYEEDLQTGATTDLTTTGGTAPALAANHMPTETAVGHPDPNGPQNNGGYEAITYPTFTEGGVTFSATPDFDFNPNDGSENPLPTVTDANGDTSVLEPFGIDRTMVGYATAASDNGNVVLTAEPYNVSYFTPYSSSGTTASPQYDIVYRSPPPTLTLDPVNGNNEIDPGARSVTLTGTSNAIGQVVEIDFGQAGAKVGTATVQSDGRWSYSFDPSTLTGSSLFIEASVMSAAGTPAETSETATISTQPPASVTSITGSDEEFQPSFGPGETLTVYVNTSAPVTVSGTPTLTLSNGAVATYSAGSGTDQIDFTYVPAITDTGSSDLTVSALNLPGGATITDANGNALSGSFDQALGLTLQTVPVIDSLDPAGVSSDFITNSATPGIVVSAEEGETVTLYDNGTAIGTGTTPDLGAQGITEVEIAATVPLPEGQSTLTASATDGSGHSSALSDPVTITVDTVPPAETIGGLAVNGNDAVSLAAQAGRAITVTGTLSAGLQPGESVTLVLPDGTTETVTPATGATSFSFSPSAAEAASFGVSGSISAYVTDAAGNDGVTATQSFTAQTLRTLKLITADGADPAQARALAPALSADGGTVAFAVAPAGAGADVVAANSDAGVTAGVYVETLSTGAVTLAAAGAVSPALSGDGSILAYDANDSSDEEEVYAKNLMTGGVTLVSAAGGIAADNGSFGASISADGGTIAFLSDADNLVTGVSSPEDNAQLYVATLSAGAVTGVTAISVAPDGASGNGLTSTPALSGDGSEVVFSSRDTNLLAPADPHTANLSGTTDQIYVRALTDNAASGLSAGQMVMVSGNADGTVGNAPSDSATLSADGRYVVFTSLATNLAPSNLAPGVRLPAGVAQVYVKDLLTGRLSLVSQTAAGVVGDGAAGDPVISRDGSTVVFSDSADNFGAGAVGQQLYAANLSNGAVTGLTLLSEAGAIPGDGGSTGASLSADGATVVFESTSDNLVAGSGTGEQVYETATAPTVIICYLAGTRIATPAGEVPIETLRCGDRLITRFGGERTIAWIGRQSFAADFLGRNRGQWPVRIKAGALGIGRPVRDLFVSPGHSMLIEDRLVLARNLVNGVTITQDPPMDDVHYYQVEFASQDCILAEGSWSESYADDEGLRNQFHNVAEFWALFPNYKPPAAPALCAPRPESGPALEAALRPIVARAAAAQAPGALRGFIDTIEPSRITGWAQDMTCPELPVLLEIRLHGALVGSILACDFRGDLEAAGIGRGYSSFDFISPVVIPAGSAGHLTICRSGDGAPLRMTPQLRARVA